MNIVNDVKAVVQFFVDRRKARKEPVQQVKHREPSVSFYDTVEGCVIWNLPPDIYEPAARAFRELPYEVKHRMAFSPKNGEFCERAKLWKEEVLQPVLSQKQSSTAMIAILRWYRHIKAMQQESVVNQFIAYTEKTEGRRPTNEAIRIFVKLDNIGQMFEAMGRRAAASGDKPCSREVFMECGEKKFPNSPKFAELFADLMQSYYMGGYNGGAES